MMRPDKIFRLTVLISSLALSGCASTSHNPNDPFESFNRGVYKFNDTVDKAVAKPLAKGYNAVVPTAGRMMLTNFFSNLNDVVVTVNDLLQFKLAQAASDTGRVVVNSTFGMLGIADVATAIHLEKHNEDFGQTLGYWGFGSGPYLMLPFFGPSSVRDSIGMYPDSRASVMRRVNDVPARNEATLTNLLGKRAALLEQEKVVDEASLDRYSFIRDAYLQHRRSLVYDGNPPREKYDDDDDDSKPDGKGSPNVKGGEKPQSSIQTDPTVSDLAPESNGQKQASVMRVWLPQGASQQ